ncbi:hypothetical protein Bca52824_023173 [Brassica carinata]|uniref:Uncharacterized protein n=1 Tax=Brassica carinata TaxID=52824 RepID=A0A8X7VI80_BRACI|nr:hypothetical protein Bca52824_023173 [Brassica carinata]
MDDRNRHRATGTTASHHRKQRHTPPPLAKHANKLERALKLLRRRTNRNRPYQDTRDRAKNRRLHRNAANRRTQIRKTKDQI